MPTNQLLFPTVMGPVALGPGSSVANTPLSAAATWGASSFVLPTGKTVNAVRARISAGNGTFSNGTGAVGDLTCEIQPDGGNGVGPTGTPVSGGSAQNLTAVVNGAGWYAWSGFTAALTANTMYWLVFKNAAGTPATNFPTLQWITQNTMPFVPGGSAAQFGWCKATTTNSGTAWTVIPNCGGYRIDLSDGSYIGSPASNLTSGDNVFSFRESGIKFTMPGNSNVTWNVRGVCGFVLRSGTPTGNPRFGLYTGSQAPGAGAYTNVVPKAVWGNFAKFWCDAYFSSQQQIAGGSTVRLTLAEDSQSDTSSNVYQPYEYTWDGDSNSLPLRPFSGTCGKTATTDGSTWTDTAAAFPTIGLILDTDGEATGAGGGGPVGQQCM